MERECELIHGRYLRRRLFKVGSYWRVRIRDALTGQVLTHSTREKNRARALQKAIDFIEELRRQSERKEQEATSSLSAALEEWLNSRPLRASTRRGYDSVGRIFLRAFGPNGSVSWIKYADVGKFLADLARNGCSARTRQLRLGLLRSFFQWAIRMKYATEDPTSGHKVGRGEKRHVGQALTNDEARRLLAACRATTVQEVVDWRRGSWSQSFSPPDHLWLAVLIALHTGLRLGNVIGLRWSDVDLRGRTIKIPGERMKAHMPHEAPIHPELHEVLAALLHRKKTLDLDEPVLGRELREIRRSFKAALRRAELPDIRWHDLRHTFATWTGTRAPYAVWRALLGHAPATVSERYFHAPMDELRRVVEGLPRLLTAEPSSATAP